MTNLARVSPAHGRAEQRSKVTHFCTHCASLSNAPNGNAERPHRGRVCPDCALGVILSCSRATLDTEGAAFLVVTADLRITAASESAERLFRVPDGLYGRPLLSVMTSPDGIGDLARQVVRAASGARRPVTVEVDAAASRVPRGVTRARIGGCGSPPAALVVIDSAAG
ncbi:MAG: PAS domain-containing protein [Actinobacteria bacterium]|nr:PAS domain-containing protein [Actinomycetota bacterium]